MASNLEDIVVRLRAMTEGFEKKVSSAQKGLVKFGDTTKNSFKKMNAPMQKTVHYFDRFHMEMLGVMFAGMGIQRVFNGLIKTSTEWMGVTDVLSTALGMLFLPIAEFLLDVALQFLEWVGSLTEEQKKWIGIIVLCAIGLGILLAAVGSIVLGLSSLSMVFGGLGGIISKVGGLVPWLGSVFGALTAPIIAVVAAIVAVVIGMYLAWKENFLGMKDTVANFIAGVKQFFGGIISIISGILDIVKAIFTGDFDLMVQGVKKIFQGLWDWLIGGFKATFNFIKGIITGVLEILKNVINLLLKAGTAIKNFVSGKGFNTKGALQIPSFQEGGTMPYTGLAYLHKGETITPANETGGSPTNISISPVYNINVSDKSEMEKYMRDHDIKLVSDIKRMVGI